MGNGTTVAFSRRILIFPVLIAFASSALAADIHHLTNVSEYAKGCYGAAGLNLTPAQIAMLEPAAGFNCRSGTYLPTEWTLGTPPMQHTFHFSDTDLTWPDGSARAAGQFPPKCDNPSWLSNRCYGHSYVQRLATGTPKVAAVLLCRHKGTWGNDPTAYDDIAIIMHNFENGNTCWFQAAGGAGTRDGTAVVPPSLDTTTAYWFEPRDTASVNCIGCHDSGPFMHSPWMHRAGVVPGNTKGKYLTPGAAFAGWPAADFVTVAKESLRTKNRKKSCTNCHAISKRLFAANPAVCNATSDSGNGAECGTWGRWIDWVTAAAFPSVTSDYGKTWERAGWMPSYVYPGAHGLSEKAWKDIYKDHVAALKACANTPGGAGCSHDPDGSLVQTNAPTQATMTVALAAPALPNTLASTANLTTDFAHSLLFTGVGDTATFSWTTDGVSACVAEATFPPAVSVGSLHTASNFTGASGTVPIGPLTVAGDYVLDLSCDGPFASSGEYVDVASLTAQVTVRVLSKDQEKCQQSLSKAVGKLARADAKCVSKCDDTAQKGGSASDCVPPYAGEALECITKAEGKANVAIGKRCDESITQKDTCTRCYDDADNCSPAAGFAEWVEDVEARPVAATTAVIDALNPLLFCADTGTLEGAEYDCRQAVVAEAGKLFAALSKCQAKCRHSQFKRRIDAGECDPGAPTDPKALECVTKAKAKFAQQCASKCVDTPDCAGGYPSCAAWTTVIEGSVDEYDDFVHCG